MVDKLTYRFVEPKRGEVVVFRYPANRRRKFIKRIVGLPGDEILIRNGYLYINGQRIEEPFVNGPTYGPYSTPAFGPVVVPEDSFLCWATTGATVMTAAIQMLALYIVRTSWA